MSQTSLSRVEARAARSDTVQPDYYSNGACDNSLKHLPIFGQ